MEADDFPKYGTAYKEAVDLVFTPYLVSGALACLEGPANFAACDIFEGILKSCKEYLESGKLLQK